MNTITNHTIRVVIEGKEIRGWTSYSISTGLLMAADQFQLERAFDREAWDLCKPDRSVSVIIDKVTIIFGYIDEREMSEDADTFTITGRDKVGRLVQESAPTISFAGLSAEAIIKQIASPWFDEVSGTNLRNRRILRGKKGRLSPAGSEPLIIGRGGKALGSRVEPGQTRWAAIVEILRQVGCIAWSSGDGVELVIGQPNYTQEPQFVFFRPAPGSARTAEGNVITMGERHSVADRYSRIDVVGSGAGNSVHYGTSVVSRSSSIRNGPNEDGTGEDFIRPKRLLMLEDVKSIFEAEEYAGREMARRDIDGIRVSVTAPLHGQRVASAPDLTYFACDTLAVVENEASGFRFTCVILSCTFTTMRNVGEVTKMELVPVGQELFF